MSSSSDPQRRTALVFGASGITGWAILREALRYPGNTTFSRVIGLFTRPTDREQLFLPADDRLVLASGLDLSKGVDDVANTLKGVEGIQDVTDVYFAGVHTTSLVTDGCFISFVWAAR